MDDTNPAAADAPDDALVLFAHGARDPNWARPFHAIRERLRERLPGRRVELAFLELMAPSLDEAIDALAADGARRVRVLPLFLGAGGHVRRDLPLLIEGARARHPALRVEATAPIGEHDAVLDAISGACADLVR